MSFRLSLDLGSTSLGWCLLKIEKETVVDITALGVRIFSDGRDGKTKEPLAVSRRNARGARRNLDRRKWRRELLLDYLTKQGLFPSDPKARKQLEGLDPYELRADALDKEIPLHHLGRVLFHINQRRGFKSNRKADKRENDLGPLKTAIKDLDAKLLTTTSRTLGEYFWKLRKENKYAPVRVRRSVVGKEASYNFYTGREMYEAEVDKILNSQKRFHPELIDRVCARIKEIVFSQRLLKPQEVGKCLFENSEPRARLALPIVQKFRILQEVNNLEIDNYGDSDRNITPEDRKKIIQALMANKKRTFRQIRTLLRLGQDVKFNLESDKRTDLGGDETSYLLSDEKAFGKRWRSFTQDQQEAIIFELFEEPNSQVLVQKLIAEYGLNQECAENISDLKLPDGYGRLSKKAIMKMLPFLEAGDRYAEAARKAGYHHSDFRTGVVFDALPYYGEVLESSVIGGTHDDGDKQYPEKFYGKINNPSVHIALNQVRRLVNEIIITYGKPDEVVIELARELKEPVDEINKQQADNTRENKRINGELEKLGVSLSYRNRMLFKLWEDLAKQPEKRCCPFSGIQISAADIFSGKFEEEHLLPFSRSFNDKRANKVLSHIDWNRRKGNRSPFEAFGHEPFWPEILARAHNLPSNKQWRFKEDAWAIADGKDGVISRLLNDTRYMSKLAKEYLAAVFENEKGKQKVRASTGQLTALLRDKLGLNDLLGDEDGKKDRTDHRHHAIDAFVIGLSDQGLLNQMAKAAHRMETTEGLWEKRRKLIDKVDAPFPGFREKIRALLENTIISFKPDHGDAQKAIHAPIPYTVAALLDQTALGFIADGEGKNEILVATRVAVEDMLTRKNIGEIADPVIRDQILDAVNGFEEKSKEWKQALSSFIERSGTRRVRIHFARQKDTLVGISSHSQPHNPYKFYATGGNYSAEIYCPNKGKRAGKWQCEVISNFDAHQKGFQPKWKIENPTAKLVMRLQIDDMVAYEKDGKTVVCRVKKIAKESGGRISFRPHTIAKEEGDKLSWRAVPSGMQEAKLRKISVDVIGRVRDPLGVVSRR
ncbi:MAG: type II CRISPR RNA-guided endonuclease Cas9 [Alphaproteobacteria bacterium]|nr:type II CRISPR RNA-guided endonuclease Cas9 [Alphaproteobacteria bacterium]